MILVLIIAFFEALGDTIREMVKLDDSEIQFRQYKEIDFSKIKRVTLDYTETAYRTEVKEEYDPVETCILSDMNGAPCYATKKVEYQIEDGVNYCFTITYKNGDEIFRKFHQDSVAAERLLKYCNK